MALTATQYPDPPSLTISVIMFRYLISNLLIPKNISKLCVKGECDSLT